MVHWGVLGRLLWNLIRDFVIVLRHLEPIIPRVDSRPGSRPDARTPAPNLGQLLADGEEDGPHSWETGANYGNSQLQR